MLYYTSTVVCKHLRENFKVVANRNSFVYSTLRGMGFEETAFVHIPDVIYLYVNFYTSIHCNREY